MRKCYIAGKIGDLPEAEYKAKFEHAKAEVIALGFEPVSPLDLPHEHGRTWSEFMREDLIEMLKCESVYALRDWRQSPGAWIEVATALSVGLRVITQKALAGKNYTNNEINKLLDSVNYPLGVSFAQQSRMVLWTFFNKKRLNELCYYIDQGMSFQAAFKKVE